MSYLLTHPFLCVPQAGVLTITQLQQYNFASMRSEHAKRNVTEPDDCGHGEMLDWKEREVLSQSRNTEVVQGQVVMRP